MPHNNFYALHSHCSERRISWLRSLNVAVNISS